MSAPSSSDPSQPTTPAACDAAGCDSSAADARPLAPGVTAEMLHGGRQIAVVDPQAPVPAAGERIERTDAEWQAMLTPEQYHVLRQHGTERAFHGAFHNHPGKGIYHCAGCNAPLYASVDKFDSGTGWPSYTQPAEDKRIKAFRDTSYGMVRVEIRCACCDGHLGHVFPDGPAPTGMRHCINGVALRFRPIAD